MELHVHTDPDRLAPYVLLPGDPGRARHVAETFLDDAHLTTDNRGLLGYTGSYQGLPVSVQTTGMGCPSLAIVVEELIRLGARTLVRIGTAGIVSDRVRPGERIVADSAVPLDGTTRMYLGGAPYAPAPDFGVTRALVDGAAQHGGAHVGLLQTEDAFYATRPDEVPAMAARGIVAVEMEAAALFLLGRLRGVRTGCMVVASNHVGDPTFVAPEVLRSGVDAMVRSSLDAFVQLERDAA
ncbi:MAG: purine-nucleoside phosphorylase [Trueperaceae bacterium]